MQDNKNHIDISGYSLALDKLDPITRAQLKHGDWNVRPEGNMFKRVWFRVIDRISVPAKLRRVARGWDFAATEGAKGDPDYTVGTKMALDYAGNYYVFDVQRTRSTPANVEILVKQTAVMDGTGVSHYQRNVLLGYTVIAKKPTGDKITRAKPFSAAAEQGRVYVVNGDWVDEYLSEICSFGSGTGHDDQVDASVAAFESLNDGLLFAGSDGGGQMNNVACGKEIPDRTRRKNRRADRQ
jgi:predicted phage terminase large subunit-like protein